MSAFCEYLLDIPSESPALAACVEEHGIDFAHFFPAADARELLEKGPAFVRGVASWWSWKVIEEVLPLPTCVYPAEPGVLARRGHTVLALQKAAVRHLVRVHGPVKRPSAPQVGPCSPCVALVDSGVCRPDAFPKACPRTARFVVGLEGPPAAPEDLLSAYHLGVDRRHLWWILWADAGGGAPPALAAWCPRGGLTPVQAAFLLLEASLTRDRERYGTDCRRPRVAIDGILDEDLADVLLDRIWPTE